MDTVAYHSGNKSLIDKVKPLWEELNRQHLSFSPYFKDYYRALTFEERKRAILQRAALKGDVRVDLACDKEQLVGYCVSSIDRQLTGEIDSIFVIPSCRDKASDNTYGKGIGMAQQ